MSFLEIQFPTDISYGSSFGPGWQTNVIRIRSGHEQRNQRWANPLYRGDVAYGVKTRSQMLDLIAFFQEVRGRAHGFRFKDWQDYAVTDEVLNQDGSPTVQLIKKYGTGSNDYTRDITKPVSGSVTLTRGGPDPGDRSDYSTFTLDTTTGIVTLTADSTADISNIAQDASGTVTATGHGFATGDEIHVAGVNGMTQVNDNVYTITVVDVDTFTLGTDTSGFTAYTSGGTASLFVQSSELLTWSGEFDVPVRFDTDEISATYETYNNLSATVPVMEVRRQ